ncbi:LLM class flavin-dependent oxidoreductase [Phenylobacterium sp.]|uniref:LLM class flavin-dependent oxidoreductase n=1 Tax=Phenylobacterium sp. TaxID=1871053 RepID=UPI0035659B94
MRFGLFGGPARPPGQAGDGKSFRQFVDYVTEAEQLGFESVFLVEHHFTGAGQVSASLTLLSYLAGLTSTMRLGTAVTVMPWHHPLLLAEQAATVDILSNGRLDFGVGRGYRANEFHGFNIDAEEAQDRFEEALALVLKSWTAKERFSHDGRFWSFRDVIVEPQPVQDDPHPPIWVAAGSEGSVRKAAATGQRLLLDQFGSTELSAQRVAWYRDAQAKAGVASLPNQVALTRGLLLVDHASKLPAEFEMRHRIGQMIAASAMVPGQAPPPNPTGPFVLDKSNEATAQATVNGTPDDCIARLKELEAAGVDYVLFNDPWGGIERLRLFAREVMPAFRRTAAAA